MKTIYSPRESTGGGGELSALRPAGARPAPGCNGSARVIWQVGLFALVGVANTVLDFALYNLLTSKLVGWPRIPANLASTTVAMIFSFVVNLFWVFSPQRSLVPKRAGRFLLVTGCALFGVQNLVIWLTSSVWATPIDQFAARCVELLSLNSSSVDLFARNLVKALATIASMTWNYLWYRNYVFRNL